MPGDKTSLGQGGSSSKTEGIIEKIKSISFIVNLLCAKYNLVS